jgi:hypothetical protein
MRTKKNGKAAWQDTVSAPDYEEGMGEAPKQQLVDCSELRRTVLRSPFSFENSKRSSRVVVVLTGFSARNMISGMETKNLSCNILLK